MKTFSLPDRSLCDWWDWKQPNGKIIRICYINRFNFLVDGKKSAFCWETIRGCYTQEQLEFIGGHFKAVPIEDF